MWLLLSPDCLGGCERLALVLYAAGAPVSGLFSALAGDLPLAYLTDLLVWLAVAVGAARLVERRPLAGWQVAGAAMAVALLYGGVISTLIQRV